MKQAVLCQHIGLGDHIICNAITRHFAKSFDQVVIPTRNENIESVEFMFRDLENFKAYPVEGWEEMKSAGQWFEKSGANVFWFGFNNPPFDPSKFDVEFYRQAGLSIDEKWSGWKLDRSRQTEFFPDGIGHDYTFIHDDPSRSFSIDPRKVRDDIPVVTNRSFQTNNIFNFCSVLEHATEVHCINSCIIYPMI